MSLPATDAWRSADSVTIAHLSDVHLPFDDRFESAMLVSKQVFGWLSWRVRRRRLHLAHVIDRLTDDLRDQRPDHTLITGDLINLSLAGEFRAAAGWLASLGSGDRVTVVPGNHDAYVPMPWASAVGMWSENFSTASPPADAAGWAAFPFVRTVGPVAVIALSTAVPTPPGVAAGTLGRPQLDRLAAILAGLDGRRFCRLVALHHPPVAGHGGRRKRLTDAPALAAVLGEYGADLVVHGHDHRFSHRTLPGPAGPIPVIGVPSASMATTGQYHLYRIRPAGPAWEILLSTRRYDAQAGRFIAGAAYAVNTAAETGAHRPLEGVR